MYLSNGIMTLMWDSFGLPQKCCSKSGKYRLLTPGTPGTRGVQGFRAARAGPGGPGGLVTPAASGSPITRGTYFWIWVHVPGAARPRPTLLCSSVPQAAREHLPESYIFRSEMNGI